MQAEALQLTVDSKGAVANLGALSRALDGAGRAFDGFERSVSADANKIDAALQKSMRSAEKAAKVAQLLGQTKINGGSANALKDFASALDSLGRARTFTDAKLKSLQDFIRLLPQIRAPGGVAQLQQFMTALSSAKAPSQAQIRNLSEFLKVLSSYKGSSATRGSNQITTFLQALAGAQAPSAATIKRLGDFLNTLSNARGIPNASKIANDLMMVANAAQRASASFASLPANMRGFAAPATGASTAASNLARNAAAAGKTVAGAGTQIAGARSHVKGLGVDLGGLGDRFKLSYQAGTVFSALFSSFTIGQFVKGIYDAGIEMAKLQKAMLFTTGSFEGAQKATGEFMGMAQELGLSIDKTAESFGRFSITAKTAGLSADSSKKIFSSVSKALQVVGASNEQTQYAFYGLTQMMQKGKVSSEEFNRQIGEQLPGNAEAGRRALSKLEGRAISMGEFFKKMSLGSIMSADFVPAWAEEINKMFDPLNAIAQKRPDVALNRLGNAFKLFSATAANAGFMGAAGKSFDELAKKMVVTKNGALELTPEFQALADRIGTNLGKAVKTAGDFLKFLAENIDGVVNAAKILLAIKIGSTLVGWGRDAADAAGAFKLLAEKIGLATTAAAAQQEVKIGTGVAATTADIIASRGHGAGRGATGRPMGSGMMQSAGFAVDVATSFGKRAPKAVVNTGRVVQGAEGLAGVTARMGANAAAGAAGQGLLGAGATRGLSALAGPLRTVLGLLSNAHPLLKAVYVAVLAAGAAWAVFGNRMTEVQGKQVKVNDILGASFKILGNNLKQGWMDGIGKNFQNFNKWLDEAAKGSGSFVTQIATGLVWLGEFVGKLGQQMAYDLVKPFKQVMAAIEAWKKTGKVSDAIAAADKYNKPGAQPLGQMRSWKDIQAEVEKTAIKTAEDRKNGSVNTAKSPAELAAEAALQRQNAQNAAAEAQGRADQLRDILSPVKTPTIEELQKSFVDLAAAANKATDNVAAMGSGVATASLMGGDAKDQSYNLIKQFEGYKEKAYWDVNHYRAGFGSDTWTDTKGGVHNVTKDTKVGGTEAALDLKRRIGIFQGNAAKTAGQANWDKLADSTKAALTSITYNYGHLPSRLLAAVKTGDNGKIATAVEGLAGDNNGVNRKRRMQEAALIRNGKVQAVSATDVEDLAEKYNNARGTWEGLAASLNPGAAAVSDLNKFILTLEDLRKKQEDFNKVKPGAPQIVDTSVLDALIARKKQEVEDLTNPLGKDNRDAQKALEIDRLRANGMEDMATWQEKLNKLQEQGYPLASMNLDAEKERFLQLQNSNRVLEAQVSLAGKLRDIEAQRIARTGNGFQAAEANAVAGLGIGKETLDQTRNRLKQQGTYDPLVQGIQAQEGERRSAAMQSARDQFSEMSATAGLSDKDKRYREAYKSYLKDLTGSQADALSTIEQAATDAERKMAKGYTDLLRQLENPPGFQRWAAALQPFADRLQDIKANFMDGLSDGITAALTGDKFDWRSMLHGISQQLVKAQVDSMLGSVVTAITGKPAALKPEQQAMLAAQTQTDAALTQGQAAQLQYQAAQTIAQAAAGGGMGATAGAAPGGAIGVLASAQRQAASQVAGAIGQASANGQQALASVGTILNGALAPTPSYGAANDNISTTGAMDVTNAAMQVAQSQMTVSATSVSLNAAQVNGLGGAGGGLAGSVLNTGLGSISGATAGGVAGGGLGGLFSGIAQGAGSIFSSLTGGANALSNITNNAVSVADNVLKPLIVDSTGGPGFQAAGSFMSSLGKITPPGGAGGLGGFFSNLGSGMGGLLQGAGSIFSMFAGPLLGQLTKPKNKAQKFNTDKPLNGIIGERRAVNLEGRAVGPKQNVIGTILSIATDLFNPFGGLMGAAGAAGGAAGGAGGLGGLMSMFGGGGGAGGMGGLMSMFGGMGGAGGGMGGMGGLMGMLGGGGGGMGGLFGGMAGQGGGLGGLFGGLSGSAGGGGGLFGMLGGLFGGFEEGGIVGAPVTSVMGAVDFRNAPHYKEGTANTSGGIPSILHPNEAVIPLSRGRAVPVEMNDNGRVQPINVSSNFTIVTPDPNGFRQSAGSMIREQNKAQKRAARRNLTPGG
ncbi:tail length tape measure protein [Caulobacter phage CcrBL9]|uniref:Tail tape measure protein n=1 Tax=Caulobacter phage CcrBL9 TaxID=2283270 RepID=A0A385EC06_9CAUD|nr:tail length tape measure protein [Caulobacter phage CcrBL9]AXQ69190.1 tail tape measure protein [Caulobacter phage CcrBL9]